MAVVLDAVDGGVSATSTITSAGASPNGSDRLMIACATGRSAADDLKTGGSGGTSLTKLSTDVSLFFDTWFANVWSIHQGPTGSTTGWVDFGSGTASAFSIVYLEGVDQTTPRTTAQTAGPTTSSTPSLAFTGLSAGQVVYAAIMAGNLPTAVTGFTENGSSTEQRADYSAVDGERQSITIWLSGTADGSGNVTLGGTFTGGVDVCDWYMYGFGINAAASGSTGTVAYTNAADTSAASGTTTVTGTLARTNTADTGAASGTTTVAGSLARTNANDTSAAAGTTTITGSLATTNANDTLAASGEIGGAVSGTLATTNANDTSVGSGTTTVAGSLARANTNDTSAAAGTTTIVGALAYANADDTVSASGTAGTPTGTVNYTNNDDTVSAQSESVTPSGGGGGRRGKQKQRYKITPQLPVQQEPEELPGEEVEYLEPSAALPVDQFGDEVDGRIILANADIEALGAELDKRQALLKQQIQDFEDILTYL